MKLSLLIQGPVESGGLTGKTWGKGKTSAPKENFSNFNAAATVKRNIEIGTNFFEHVVFSTWENEDTSFLDYDYGNFVLLKNVDPGPVDGFVRSPIRGILHTHENNTSRQFESMYKGIEASKSLGATHVIKIRSDQELDLVQLRAEICRHFETQNDSIFVPFIDSSVPWSIPDFYIGIEINHGLTLSKLMTHAPRFSKNVHVDFFLKEMMIRKPELLLPDFVSTFFHTAPNPRFESIARSNVLDMFMPGTSGLFYNVTWRGEKIVYKSPSFLFIEDSKLRKINEFTSDRARVTDTKQALEFLFTKASFRQILTRLLREHLQLLQMRKFGLPKFKLYYLRGYSRVLLRTRHRNYRSKY